LFLKQIIEPIKRPPPVLEPTFTTKVITKGKKE
jgi:hypothetical protein